jgi:hypothetical protein
MFPHGAQQDEVDLVVAERLLTVSHPAARYRATVYGVGAMDVILGEVESVGILQQR